MWKYQRQQPNELVSLTIAKRSIQLFGRPCDFSLTTYVFEGTASIIFGLKPQGNGIIGLNHTTDGRIRTIEQHLVIPDIDGSFLEPSHLDCDEEVYTARTISRALLQTTASMVEGVRQSIRDHLGKECFERAVQHIDNCWGSQIEKCMATLYDEINWPLMLEGSGASERVLQVIETSMRNHNIEYHPLGYEGVVTIQPLVLFETFRIDKTRLSDLKATVLLKHVCGEEYYNEFVKHSRITIEHEGYTFVVAPGRFVKATDPYGHSVELCIHTVGFSCNPIDELVLAYLHIKNQFEWYMKTANIFGRGKFQLPNEKSKNVA